MQLFEGRALLGGVAQQRVLLLRPAPPTAIAAGGGAALTAGGELNKLAYNVAIGRDFAGVHWRSDGEEGLRLGEAVAMRALQDLRLTYTEAFPGFTLTRFNGTQLTI